ncbi:MAG: hypothetical protein M3R59_03010 [Verrucomicrobiota bacterium]|nr:hypothetical protein [Verrucomicrobiota bacterium]
MLRHEVEKFVRCSDERVVSPRHRRSHQKENRSIAPLTLIVHRKVRSAKSSGDEMIPLPDYIEATHFDFSVIGNVNYEAKEPNPGQICARTLRYADKTMEVIRNMVFNDTYPNLVGAESRDYQEANPKKFNHFDGSQIFPENIAIRSWYMSDRPALPD